MSQMSHLLSRHSSFHCVHYHGGGRREGGVFICYLLNNLCADIWHKLQQHTSQHIIQLRPGHEIQSVTKHWELNIQEHRQLCLLCQCCPEDDYLLDGDCDQSFEHFMINFGGKRVFCSYTFDEKEFFTIN